MTDAPEVSVIVPTRDRWRILARSALPAALMQEDVNLELIVVDDGSTDETQSGLASFRHTSMRVYRNEVSRGVSAARNRGIDVARGEWVAFLDDDDIWAPRKLRTQIDVAREAGAGFVFSSAVTVDRHLRPRAYRSPPELEDLSSLLFRGNVVPSGCSNVVARTELVRRVGGFDEGLSMIADWDLWLRLALDASAAGCADVHVGYQEHGGNMAFSTPRDVLRESRYFAEKHRRSGSGQQVVDRLASVRWVAWANFWAGNRLLSARLLLRAGIAEASLPDLSRGLRFLVWALAPDSFSRALWRVRHMRDADAPGLQAVVPRPEWLDRYATLATRPERGLVTS